MDCNWGKCKFTVRQPTHKMHLPTCNSRHKVNNKQVQAVASKRGEVANLTVIHKTLKPCPKPQQAKPATTDSTCLPEDLKNKALKNELTTNFAAFQAFTKRNICNNRKKEIHNKLHMF